MPPQKLSARFRDTPYKYKNYFQLERRDHLLKSIFDSRRQQISMNISI